MKYWRGFLVAAIIAACTWGLMEFAQSHWLLVDMVYPYVSRLIQNYMANWSSGVSYCLWQMCVLVLFAGVLASVVMMVIWKWNPIQWLGWVLAVISVVVLLSTGLYGLNQYAGPIADDIRMEVTDCTVEEMQNAALLYQSKANALSQQVSRDSDGRLQFADFDTLASQAGEGFETLTYTYCYSVFAGSTVPVKELGWSSYYTGRGLTGVYNGITGEAAVNPDTPTVGLPFAMCRQIAKRRCIASEQDISFAAFLAGSVHSSVEFQYSAYFMAYRYCYNALAAMNITSAQTAASTLLQGECTQLRSDLESYNSSFAVESDFAYAPKADAASEEAQAQRSDVVELLVSWHIQEYVLPEVEEEEVKFDPMDESQVDLSGIANAK